MLPVRGAQPAFYATICRAVERVGNKIRSNFAACAFSHSEGPSIGGMSSDPTQEYFAHEMSLLSFLASPGCLSSPAIPASSTRAKPQMYARLDMIWGCTTSWRGASDRVRIFAQLTGIHRWAEYL